MAEGPASLALELLMFTLRDVVAVATEGEKDRIARAYVQLLLAIRKYEPLGPAPGEDPLLTFPDGPM